MFTPVATGGWGGGGGGTTPCWEMCDVVWSMTTPVSLGGSWWGKLGAKCESAPCKWVLLVSVDDEACGCRSDCEDVVMSPHDRPRKACGGGSVGP